MVTQIKHRLTGEVLAEGNGAISRVIRTSDQVNFDYADLRNITLEFEKLSHRGLSFRSADFSGTNCYATDFSGVDLSRANFSGANLSQTIFRRAILNGAIFTRTTKFSGTVFESADLTEADFRNTQFNPCDRVFFNSANLSRATFHNADLHQNADLYGAKFTNANLEGCNLKILGVDYIPVISNIDAAILSAIQGTECYLDLENWHSTNSCETRHCRAGWAIVLAGKAGAELETFLGAELAGTLIYAASGSNPSPDFFCSDEDLVFQDMKDRAARFVKRGK